MSQVMITESYLEDIADAIRTKNGQSSATYTPTQMATAILNISTSGGGSATPTPTLQTKSVSITPSETAQSQTVTADTGYDGLDEVSVSVSAISSSYVGSGVTQRSSTDLSVSGGTVTAPAGYYASSASKAVASGTAGTPTATKGTVSNYSVSVTPSVTNTTGYITGSTKTGTAVSVSASELVSGNKEITSNGTDIDVANYATASVSVTANPSMETKTTSNSDNTATSLSFTSMKGTPKAFFLRCTSQLTRSSSYSYYYIVSVRYNGASSDAVRGNYWRMSNGTFYNDTSHYSYTYSGTTLTISSSASRGAAGGSFYNGNYELVYVY